MQQEAETFVHDLLNIMTLLGGNIRKLKKAFDETPVDENVQTQLEMTSQNLDKAVELSRKFREFLEQTKE